MYFLLCNVKNLMSRIKLWASADMYSVLLFWYNERTVSPLEPRIKYDNNSFL